MGDNRGGEKRGMRAGQARIAVLRQTEIAAGLEQVFA